MNKDSTQLKHGDFCFAWDNNQVVPKVAMFIEMDSLGRFVCLNSIQEYNPDAFFTHYNFAAPLADKLPEQFITK